MKKNLQKILRTNNFLHARSFLVEGKGNRILDHIHNHCCDRPALLFDGSQHITSCVARVRKGTKPKSQHYYFSEINIRMVAIVFKNMMYLTVIDNF